MKTETNRIRDVMPTVIQKLEAMHARAKQWRVDLERFAAKKPKKIVCQKGGQPHAVDMDASFRLSWPDKPFELVYAPCSVCVGLEQSKWMGGAGVPKILIEASFDNWWPRTEGDKTALRAVREFAAAGKGFLVIVGSVGLGKSHLAVSVMRQRGCGRIITQTRLLLKLRDRYHNKYSENVIEKYKTTRLLVLDEFGFTTGARDEPSALYDVIDYRHGEMLPTVLTTNVPVSQFDEAFGDRIADRLRCHQPFVVLSGSSWRGTK